MPAASSPDLVKRVLVPAASSPALVPSNCAPAASRPEPTCDEVGVLGDYRASRPPHRHSRPQAARVRLRAPRLPNPAHRLRPSPTRCPRATASCRRRESRRHRRDRVAPSRGADRSVAQLCDLRDERRICARTNECLVKRRESRRELPVRSFELLGAAMHRRCALGERRSIRLQGRRASLERCERHRRACRSPPSPALPRRRPSTLRQTDSRHPMRVQRCRRRPCRWKRRCRRCRPR